MNIKTLLPTRATCIECNCSLTEDVYTYSKSTCGAPLCYHHQMLLQSIPSTNKAIRLYLALKSRGVPAEIEKFDGYEKIEIVIPKAKLNIEVDGTHHQTGSVLALADLKRTYNSMCKGFIKLRIPNSLVDSDVEQAADLIVGIMVKSNSRKMNKW